MTEKTIEKVRQSENDNWSALEYFQQQVEESVKRFEAKKKEENKK